MLARAEKVTGAAKPQILLGDLKTVVGFRHDFQPRLGIGIVTVGHKHAVALVLAAPHSAAKLVELAQAEAIRVFDYHKRRIGHIDADLNDRRGHEDIYIAIHKG